MAFSLRMLLVGIVLLAVGLLFVFKNRKVSRVYQGKVLKNVLGKEAGESKGLGTYLRIRYFIVGIVFMVIGAFFMWASF